MKSLVMDGVAIFAKVELSSPFAAGHARRASKDKHSEMFWDRLWPLMFKSMNRLPAKRRLDLNILSFHHDNELRD